MAPITKPGLLSRLAAVWTRCQIRKTEEALAYWSAQAETWRQLCSSQHMSYERATLANACGKKKQLEVRLARLKERIKV